MANRSLAVVTLPGLTDYAAALEWQRALATARSQGVLCEDLLILLEHPPVITLGRGARDANLIAAPETLAQRSVTVFEVERGGDATYHGPGQLVGYPILDLSAHRKDVHWYLRQVEEALIRACGDVGIIAGRNPGYTGVWVEDRKIASIGVHVSKWVTRHGFALNVTTDLSYFDLIVPCGIPQVAMTSMEREIGAAPPWEEVTASTAQRFAEVFGLAPEPCAPDSLPPFTAPQVA